MELCLKTQEYYETHMKKYLQKVAIKQAEKNVGTRNLVELSCEVENIYKQLLDQEEIKYDQRQNEKN